MSNKTTAPQPKKEALTVAFQNFNGVFLAKISNLTGKKTHAYGSSKGNAECNAIANYRKKYEIGFYNFKG